MTLHFRPTDFVDPSQIPRPIPGQPGISPGKGVGPGRGVKPPGLPIQPPSFGRVQGNFQSLFNTPVGPGNQQGIFPGPTQTESFGQPSNISQGGFGPTTSIGPGGARVAGGAGRSSDRGFITARSPNLAFRGSGQGISGLAASLLNRQRLR